MSRKPYQSWTEPDVVGVDDIYREHGRLTASHPEMQALARRQGRTPTAVAARLRNLHGAHTETGWPGSRWHFTQLDRKVADR